VKGAWEFRETSHKTPRSAVAVDLFVVFLVFGFFFVFFVSGILKNGYRFSF